MGKSRSPADARGVTLFDYDEYIVDEQYYAMENYVEDSNFRQSAEVEEGLGKALNECLSVNCAFTPLAENQHRKKVLGRIENLVDEWVARVVETEGIAEEMTEDMHARLFTFGSYFLGVDHPDSDVDVLILCPDFLERNRDVFGLPHSRSGLQSKKENVLVEILKKEPEVENLLAVPDAFVPVIRFKFSGVQFDMISAFLPMEKVINFVDLINKGNSVLMDIDDASRRGVNAVRISRRILSLVPDEETFRTTLRAVKLWARKRGIYSNMLGYLGGISWTIMTAKVCMIFHPAPPAILLCRFFQLYYGYWDWPRPVALMEDITDDGEVGLRQWDPIQHASDRRHVMPVITPVYPAMNTTHNVSFCTFRVIIEELARAFNLTVNLCRQAFDEGMETNHLLWQPLFGDVDFFSQYVTYLQIDLSSVNAVTQVRWKGLVESRLRHLLYMLQTLHFRKVHLLPNDNPSAENLKHTFFFGIDTHNWKGAQAASRAENLLMNTVKQWIAQELEWQRDPDTMNVSFRVSRNAENEAALNMRNNENHGQRRSRYSKGGKRRKGGQQQVLSDSFDPKNTIDMEKLTVDDREKQQVTSVTS